MDGAGTGRRVLIYVSEDDTWHHQATYKAVLELLRSSTSDLGQTMVMVTHDAQAASIADRILFLADGVIVRELPRSAASDILVTMQEIS